MISGPIICWARHKSDTLVHGIISRNSGGSVVTACRGRWEITEPYEVFPLEAPGGPQDNHCNACMGAWVDRKFVERGLRELVENTYSRVGIAVRTFARDLATHSADDAAGFDWWLGPCPHGASPITRCSRGCARPPAAAAPGVASDFDLSDVEGPR